MVLNEQERLVRLLQLRKSLQQRSEINTQSFSCGIKAGLVFWFWSTNTSPEVEWALSPTLFYASFDTTHARYFSQLFSCFLIKEPHKLLLYPRKDFFKPFSFRPILRQTHVYLITLNHRGISEIYKEYRIRHRENFLLELIDGLEGIICSTNPFLAQIKVGIYYTTYTNAGP